MSKAARASDGNGEPAVLRFRARLVLDPEGKSGSRTLLAVPKAVGGELRGMTTIEGTINGHPFRAPVEPNAGGGQCLRVNKAMLAGAGANAGDTVKLAILGREPEPTAPTDLQNAFKTSSAAKTLWKQLTSDGRRIWIRWITSAKQPETRAKRVRRTVEQLAEGKRRPCCVNVYEYMLLRVRE